MPAQPAQGVCQVQRKAVLTPKHSLIVSCEACLYRTSILVRASGKLHPFAKSNGPGLGLPGVSTVKCRLFVAHGRMPQCLTEIVKSDLIVNYPIIRDNEQPVITRGGIVHKVPICSLGFDLCSKLKLRTTNQQHGGSHDTGTFQLLTLSLLNYCPIVKRSQPLDKILLWGPQCTFIRGNCSSPLNRHVTAPLMPAFSRC